MGRVRAVIFAADELLDPACPSATLQELEAVVSATARWHEVWVVGRSVLGLPSPLVERVRYVASLEDVPAARATEADDGTVLVVGSRPEGAIRFANVHALSGALIPADGDVRQATTLDETPDFILAGLEDVPLLVARLERDETDFEGVE